MCTKRLSLPALYISDSRKYVNSVTTTNELLKLADWLIEGNYQMLAANLYGILSSLLKKIMKELTAHVDELDKHIKNLDDEIKTI